MAHPDCASNRLARGEAQDMRHALLLVIAECREEMDCIDRNNPDLIQLITTITQCLRDYDAVIAQAEQGLFQQWAASADTEIKRLGEVGISRDYALLAI
jgi:hypothetical protein